MTPIRLYVSFWHLCLDNLPVGEFVHRKISLTEAKTLIEEARGQQVLVGVSHEDLLAPYKKRALAQQKQLCNVLTEHFEVKLSLEDFLVTREAGDTHTTTIIPLNLVTLDHSSRLLVVTAAYEMLLGQEAPLDFDSRFVISPETVEFHLLEARALTRELQFQGLEELTRQAQELGLGY